MLNLMWQRHAFSGRDWYAGQFYQHISFEDLPLFCSISRCLGILKMYVNSICPGHHLLPWILPNPTHFAASSVGILASSRHSSPHVISNSSTCAVVPAVGVTVGGNTGTARYTMPNQKEALTSCTKGAALGFYMRWKGLSRNCLPFLPHLQPSQLQRYIFSVCCRSMHALNNRCKLAHNKQRLLLLLNSHSFRGSCGSCWDFWCWRF